MITLRGYNANINILDEALFIPVEIIKTIVFPVAQQTNSVIIALSTPQGSDAPSTRLFNTRRKDSDQTVILIVRIGKPCDECRIKRTLCLHSESAVADGLSKKKRKLFEVFYEDDPETMLREYAGETCDNSRAQFSNEHLLDLFTTPTEPVPALVDMIMVGIDPAGGGKCEWGLCASYFDVQKQIEVIIQLDAQRIQNATPTVVMHWLQTSIESIRRRHRSFLTVPIVIACESAPHRIGEELAEDIQMLINSGKVSNVYMMYELSGSERPGVPKTETNTQDMVRYTNLLLQHKQIRFSKAFGTSVLGKTSDDAKKEYFLQLSNVKKKIDHYRKDGTAHFVINGKGNNRNDDLAVAALMVVYWYFVLMGSTNPIYEEIREKSDHWRYGQVTIDTFCNNANKRTRDDRNSAYSNTVVSNSSISSSSSSSSSHSSNTWDDEIIEEDDMYQAKRHATHASVSAHDFRI